MQHIHYTPTGGDLRPRALPVRRTDRHRLVAGRDGRTWLIVRTWYGRVTHRVPVAGYW